MKRWILALILTVIPLTAQTEPPPPPQPAQPQPAPPRYVKKLFILKYADPRALENLLRVFEASFSSNAEMHVLAVTATSQNMASIEDAIARLDTPASATKNIEMVVQLVVGSDVENTLGSPMPKDLDAVVSQLKNAFPFKSYRLLDTLTLRSRSGQSARTSSSGGEMKFGEKAAPVTTTFSIKAASIAQDGSTVRIDGLATNARLPVFNGPNMNPPFTYQDLNMNTDLDIKEGQKVVVGRFGISHDQALFLVLTARVVN